MAQTQSMELLQLASQLNSDLKNYELPESHRKLCLQIIMAMRNCAPNIKEVTGQRIILGKFKLEEVFPYVKKQTGIEDREYQVGDDTFLVKMSLSRYKVFLQNIACVRCGIIGDHFKLERMTDGLACRAHFNLYGIHPITEEHILLTKDHIKPKSKGGGNTQDNFQTMCTTCNNSKGNKLESKDYKNKKTNWISDNNRWVVTIDKISGYSNNQLDKYRYQGRAIDKKLNIEYDWYKLTNKEVICYDSVPKYIKCVISKIDLGVEIE